MSAPCPPSGFEPSVRTVYPQRTPSSLPSTDLAFRRVVQARWSRISPSTARAVIREINSGG
jgi:hypothetical protein